MQLVIFPISKKLCYCCCCCCYFRVALTNPGCTYPVQYRLRHDDTAGPAPICHLLPLCPSQGCKQNMQSCFTIELFPPSYKAIPNQTQMRPIKIQNNSTLQRLNSQATALRGRVVNTYRDLITSRCPRSQIKSQGFSFQSS